MDGYLAEARNTLAALELEMKQRLAEESSARTGARAGAIDRGPDPTAGPSPAVSPTAVSPTAVFSPTAASPTAVSPTASRTDPAISSPPSEPSRVSPVYRRWWFWTAIGVGGGGGHHHGCGLGDAQHRLSGCADGECRVTLMF